jgi:hypothetical protein
MRRTGKLLVISYSRLASILKRMFEFRVLFDDGLEGNVAEYAIAK